jgi:NDP-sugar pyrophosphorylase family protein
MLNIVVPMAGSGSRFAEAGFDKPKPFIDVHGRPMIERVLANLQQPGGRFVLIVRAEHFAQESAFFALLREKYSAVVVTVDRLTEGACCTILLAARLINTAEPLLLANSDQLVDLDLDNFIADAERRGLAGSILTFHATETKWSYAKPDEHGLVTEVREKQVISDQATVGIYYFAHGRDFVQYAAEMIAHNDRVNNEFYTCPVYNYAIRDGRRIGIYEISENQMHGLGTPEDLHKYLELTGTVR